jgi:hypothetical protein
MSREQVPAQRVRPAANAAGGDSRSVNEEIPSSRFILQLNQSGAWRNVVRIPDPRLYMVMKHTAPLARVLASGKWRIVCTPFIGGSENVFAYLDAPYGEWKLHDGGVV